MAAPNMATITASLEKSLQNCSLNHHRSNPAAGDAVGGRRSTSSSTSSSRRGSHDNDDEAPQNHDHHPDAAATSTTTTTTLELNSHISLPYHWEQCLDLKTGDIYYINWRNGMKAKEDPRTRIDYNSGDCYSDEEEEEEEEENSSYDSEESSSECSTRPREQNKEQQQVLVVGGCKSCFMYFMVPKQVQECPKCCGQLLHFDRSENGSL